MFDGLKGDVSTDRGVTLVVVGFDITKKVFTGKSNQGLFVFMFYWDLLQYGVDGGY